MWEHIKKDSNWTWKPDTIEVIAGNNTRTKQRNIRATSGTSMDKEKYGSQFISHDERETQRNDDDPNCWNGWALQEEDV